MLKPNGERLKLEMARSCLTAKELAQKAGVSPGVIYRMQKGYLIRPVYLWKVAKALAIDAEALVAKESGGGK